MLGFAGVVVVIMAYILPGFMLIQMKLEPLHVIVGYAYVVFGLFVGVVSLVEQTRKLVQGS